MRNLFLVIQLIWSLGICFRNEGITCAFCLDPKSSSSRSSRSSSSSRRHSTTTGSSAHQTMEDESDFSSEVQIALQAVRKACVITKRLQEQIDIATITKTDSSPVTVADFASQAVVLQHLYQHFPEDLFLAEESSETLIPSVTEQIQQACGIPEEAILKECIDLGQSFFQSEERRRVWCLDPIDGTKGFLRKG
jgi:3'-phosphoadenosine 5'-phosphosulfate (PAPS) 3'-phosphatase